MLAIKLQRIGKKHQPSYRVVVAEKRSKMARTPVADLGFFNPGTKATTVNKEQALHWIKVGAQPTATVHNLLVKLGIVSGPKVRIKIAKKVVAESAAENTETPAAAPVAEEHAEAKAEVEEATPTEPATPAAQ